MAHDHRPLVLHVVHRLDTGGLENGVVNLINHMPADTYRHAVLALTEVTDFRLRVLRSDVDFIALGKPPGHTLWQYPRLYTLMRQLRPHIVHSRNLAALEVLPVAWAAGVPVRIHGEHGRDLHDKDGNSVLYQRVRRLYKPFVHHYTALSCELRNYLVQKVHVPSDRVTQVYNGVDGARFHPAHGGPARIAGCPFDPQQHWMVGFVGRMQAVKNPALLAQAFALAIASDSGLRSRLRLVMVGEGPLRTQVQAWLQAQGLEHLAWLPGDRPDVAEILRGLHAFALPSLSEGISNVILESMATGLPVLATDVGGNADLVGAGVTGKLVASDDLHGMVQALVQLANDPQEAIRMGQAGRARMEAKFSLRAMVAAYQAVYDQQSRRASATLVQA
ncbi:MAG: TIGR03088 family PEP-CTERM/XrtA system glycosyltransferase [Pseudomonadota bacterium]